MTEEKSEEQEPPSRLARVDAVVKTALGLLARVVGGIVAIIMVGIVAAQIVRPPHFTIHQVEIPPELREHGVTETLVARQIAHAITRRSTRVPDALAKLFAAETLRRADRRRLLSAVQDRYGQRELDVEIDVDLVGLSVPISGIRDAVRAWLGRGDRILDVTLMQNEDFLAAHVELSTDGLPWADETIQIRRGTGGRDSRYGALGTIFERAADFVIQENDPLVAILAGYDEFDYASPLEFDAGSDRSHERRLEMLADLIRSERRHPRTEALAHAVRGVLYEHRDDHESAVLEYRKAIELDRRQLALVGPRLAEVLDARDLDDRFGVVLDLLRDIVRYDPHHLTAYRANLRFLRRHPDEVAQRTEHEVEADVRGYDWLERNSRVPDKRDLALARLELLGLRPEFRDEFYDRLAEDLGTPGLLASFDLEFPPWRDVRCETRFVEIWRRAFGEEADSPCATD